MRRLGLPIVKWSTLLLGGVILSILVDPLLDVAADLFRIYNTTAAPVTPLLSYLLGMFLLLWGTMSAHLYWCVFMDTDPDDGSCGVLSRSARWFTGLEYRVPLRSSSDPEVSVEGMPEHAVGQKVERSVLGTER